MAKPSSPLLLLCCAVAFALSAAAATLPSNINTTLTAYDVLESYNFPAGLLPKGALSYDLDPATGKFSAYLNGTCSFSLEGSYQLRYKSTISGRISKNRLSDLKGVSVKVLFLWINIVEVTRVGDDLEFSVGIASADFPISNFNVIPQCGCGVDCVSSDLDGGIGAGKDSPVIKLRFGI